MRHFSLTGFGAVVALLDCAIGVRGQKTTSPYDAVNPFIGTSGGRNTFPGATLPFGMAQLSPDTNADAWYKFDEQSIRGFSLTHISGAGCSLYGDFGVTSAPTPGTAGYNPSAFHT